MNGVKITIKDTEYNLKFSINTLCDMTRAGIDVMNFDNVEMNILTIRTFFYYALKSENKKITENKAGELMDEYIQEGHVFGDLFETVLEALAMSMGKTEETDTDEAK